MRGNRKIKRTEHGDVQVDDGTVAIHVDEVDDLCAHLQAWKTHLDSNGD